jgi:PST family polysaccharide transporter
MARAKGDDSRRVFTNIFWLALEPALRLAIAIPLAGFVAHKLGVTGYGELNYGLSFAVVFGVLANLGLTEVLLRTVARQPTDLARLWWSTLALKGLLLLGYLGTLALAAFAVGHPTRMVLLILTLGLYQGLLSLDNTARGIFMGTQRMNVVGLLSGGKTAAEVVVTVVVLLLGADALGLALSRSGLGLLGLVASVVVTLRVLRIGFERPSLPVARSLLGPGLGFAAYNAIRTLDGRVGVLVLERARGLQEVAILAAAYALVEKAHYFLPAVLDALFPFFSSIDENDRSRLAAALGRVLRYQWLVALMLAVGISLLGPWLLDLVFPRSFAATRAVLEVSGLAVLLHSANLLLLTVAGARGHERRMSAIAGVQCAAHATLALALAPRLGALGVAWATVLSELVALALLLVFLARLVDLPLLGLARLAPPAILAGLVVLAGFVLPGGRGLVWPPFLAASYPALLLATGMVSAEDRQFLLSLVKRSS